MHLKSCYILLFIMLYNANCYSQSKNKQEQASIWIRYNQQLQLPKNCMLKSEFDERFFIAKALKQHQFLFRVTVDKQLKKNWTIGAGISMWYMGTNNELATSKLMIPEWRPHVEINHKNSINKRFSISQRWRAEWRFIKKTNPAFTETINGYNNNFRFRYQILLDFAAYQKEEKSLHLIMFDEIMLNAGKQIVHNIFDQNRIGLSVRYNFNKKVGLELTYMNMFQQRSSGLDFYNRQILRCTLYNNFNITKKIKTD